jgi:uroporphyrinogen-III synthase
MLAGRRILITRTAEQARDLALALQARGAVTEEVATIRIVRPADWAPLDAALARLSADDWLVFTSANGARAVIERLDGRWPPANLAAIGPATAAALGRPALLPAQQDGPGLAHALLAAGARRAVLPRGDRATPELPRILREAGVEVVEAVAYRTLPMDTPDPALAARLSGVDWVVLASPSALEGLLGLVSREALAGVKLASIGGRTSAAIRAAGLAVATEAAEPTVAGLVAALEAPRPA